MANLFYPQLSSGALVQYPVRKTRHIRTVLNPLADGSIIAASDPYSARLRWELVYQDISLNDVQLLQQHFANCSGPWLPFVFIDPTDNMLANSQNFSLGSWQVGPTITVQAGTPDPFGANAAFTVTNSGQTSQEIAQTLTVPGNYQYCFSIYANSAAPSNLTLLRKTPDSQQSQTLATSTSWMRLVSSGQLPNTTSNAFTISISVAPGQQIALFAPQLEPQTAPSRYRATGIGGVYPNTHWAVNNLTISAASPSLFNAACAIDTNS